MTWQGIKMDEEMQQAWKGSDASRLAASIEGMKTRRSAQLMTKAMRQFNPKLAKALIDDRDEVRQKVYQLCWDSCTRCT